MAQMFSSGVTPDYLKALSDAYAQYFPQQAPVNTQALQQWYSPQGFSPNGSSAFAAPMGASMAPMSSSVVGSLFGDQFPQVRGGGGQATQGAGYASPSTQSFGAGLASAGINYGNLLGGLMPYGRIAGLLGNAYKESQLSNAALNGGYTGTYTGDAAFGDRANNVATEGGLGPLSGGAFNNMGSGGDRGGVATGGNGGDASGGGDRGTRGGF